MNTVPKNITPSLLAFCGSICRERPIFIRTKPSADAQMSACFDNVSRKIARAGGEVVYGWAIWHVPGLYFEAEHHGVWRKRQGALLDVSPQLANPPKILFLPDRDAVYDKQRFRPNIIKAVDETPLAVQFAALANDRYALINSYRTAEYSIAMLSGDDQIKLSLIDQRIKELLAFAGVRL